MLGCEDGSDNGSLDSCAEGWLDWFGPASKVRRPGCLEGCEDGSSFGWVEGLLNGRIDGMLDCCNEGRCVSGFLVGEAEVCLVIITVGGSVGGA